MYLLGKAMAYQFKEDKINVELTNIYIDKKDLDFLQEVADFFHISRSKVLSIKLQGGDYERFENRIRKYNKAKTNKKILLKQKRAKACKKNLQERGHICELLPYFADSGA